MFYTTFPFFKYFRMEIGNIKITFRTEQFE